MKKPNNSKKDPAVKNTGKDKDSGELRKPTKLKPLKEKEKKNWKNKIDDEEDDFTIDDDLKFNNNFNDDDEEDDFYNEDY